jgi:hypothetical protein
MLKSELKKSSSKISFIIRSKFLGHIYVSSQPNMLKAIPYKKFENSIELEVANYYVQDMYIKITYDSLIHKSS